MSTVIIAGGSGHNAMTRLVVVYHHATAQQQAQIVDLVNQFVSDATVLADEVDANP